MWVTFFHAVAVLFRVTFGIVAPIAMIAYGIGLGIIKQKLYSPPGSVTKYGPSYGDGKMLLGQNAIYAGVSFIIMAVLMHLFFIWGADSWKPSENPIGVGVLGVLIAACFALWGMALFS